MSAGRASGRRSLVFIGFMGAGKTSAARIAAASLRARAVDSDEVIERRIGVPIEEYFSTHGERAFREVEEETIADLLDAPPSPVVSLGGGSIASERVRAALASHTLVWLDVDSDTAWHRVGEALVEGLALGVEGVEAAAVAGLRPQPAGALSGGVGVDVEPDHRVRGKIRQDTL